MTELAPNDRQIWITRSHLLALGVATSCVALLAFLVGLQVGRSQAASAEIAVTGPMPLTPDASREETLEALLREVELARMAEGPSDEALVAADLQFPTLLEDQEPVFAIQDDGSAEVGSTVAPGGTAEPAAPSSAGPSGVVPDEGWSIQVASYPTRAEADAALATLSADGHEAYRVAALVDGQTWYRVRVGGFATKVRAETARAALGQTLGVDDLVLAAAP